MSEKQNYDKILMVSGIVLGLGVAAYGACTFMKLDDQYKFTTRVSEKPVEPPSGIKKAETVNQEISASHELKPIVQETQEYVGFVAPNLWIKTGGTEPFDIVSGPPIHGNIPNKWFLDNGLEDIFIYSDVLTRDPDNDGFTVQEEYEAKTHPNDPNSHPPLINKLYVDEIKQFGFYLVFSQADGNDFTFKGQNRARQDLWRSTVQLNGQFGARKNTNEKPRFELVSVANKEFKNESLNMVETDPEATVKDLKPTKNGQTYTVRRGAKYFIPIIDKKVNLTIAAGPKRDTSFEVEEGADFQIPGDTKQTYTLKTVDNATQTVTIANKTTGEQTTLSKKK